MGKNTEKIKIPIEIELTDGYQQRFTTEILKIHEKRLRQEEQLERNKDNKSA